MVALLAAADSPVRKDVLPRRVGLSTTTAVFRRAKAEFLSTERLEDTHIRSDAADVPANAQQQPGETPTLVNSTLARK